MSSYRALLVDLGGVVLLTPFELIRAFERDRGLAAGHHGWHGPFDLAADPAFARVHAGELREREYWAQRARSFADTHEIDDPDDALHRLFERPEHELIRPEWISLIGDAQAAGVIVAIVTNDLTHFHPQEWIDRISLLDRVDHLVDLSSTGHLKPDPRAFALALDVVGCSPGEVLFVDDQPFNLTGSSAAGIDSVLFDVTRPAVSVGEVRDRLGL
jgi:putative hydrolase of the HAD superfamily